MPHSLLNHEGKMSNCYDKAAFLHGMEEIMLDDGTDLTDFLLVPCAALDGIGFLNQLKIQYFFLYF